MTMVFQFKTVLFRNAALRLFDLGVLELHDLPARATDQVIMVGLGTPAFIIGITARPETLRDHACLQKDRKIPVDRITRDFQPLFLQAGNKDVHVEVPALALDPLDQLQPLPGQTAPFAADKPFELLLIFDHGVKSLSRLSLNKNSVADKRGNVNRV